MIKKYLSRPYMNIQKGTFPTDAYKSGKAVGLLFTLDFLTHQAEGQCTSILNQTEKYGYPTSGGLFDLIKFIG